MFADQTTPEQRLQRFYLPYWVRAVICPKGGEAEFEIILGQPKGTYLAEDLEDGAEQRDGGNEDGGRGEGPQGAGPQEVGP